MELKVSAGFEPTGDQPKAIEKLVEGVGRGGRQTLLGVTGSGKTFTIANVIARTGRNALVMSHNKTLAAQLYSEFKEFFPNYNVEYFISYYDYYLPESYIPQTDTYVEKSVLVNEKIEQMRFSTTASLLSGEPTIVVASVSCIYGLGSPQDYSEMSLVFSKGMRLERSSLIDALVAIQYERNDLAPSHGNFRARGNTIDVFPSYRKCFYRLELEGELLKSISLFSTEGAGAVASLAKPAGKLDSARLFPARHFVIPQERIKPVIAQIRGELQDQLPKLEELFAYRLKTRVNYDAEMIENTGFCKGVENYSRYFDGRKQGEKPYCLLDFFSDESLLVVDESHATLPQVRGMHAGDYSRKKNLVEYGFRLPSAYDNRPLSFNEFEKYLSKRPSIFVSATPGEYERKTSESIVEQLVRPTGIVDPEVFVRPEQGQVEDLCSEVASLAARGARTLVTTLTKRQAEDLSEFMLKKGLKARYLHSEIDSLGRTDIIRRLRLGEFDCLVGINLLREGLDIPEVGLVAILDADKQGFLRNDTSLIQTIGRAARNASSKAIMYASAVTPSMQGAIDETRRRRAYQTAFNKMHGITPATIVKKVSAGDFGEGKGDMDFSGSKSGGRALTRKKAIELEAEMKRAAESLDFEKAIELREVLRTFRESRKT